MWFYSMVMFGLSAVLMVISYKIYKGFTNLIHDYHQQKIKETFEYGKAFGKAMFVVASAPLLSGIITLFGDSQIIAKISVLVFIVLILFGIVCIVVVQYKYNKGIF